MVQSINATTPLDEARAALSAAYDLSYTKAVAKVTEHVYDRVKHRIPEKTWRELAPLIVHINRLKREKKAVIFAHVRQRPEVYFGVADRIGDNLRLLRQTRHIRQPIIVFAGVLSMAETVKLLSPRRVIVPDSRVRCSMAATITPEDVLAIRGQYPGIPVVAHVNTSVPVKALAESSFTAANVLDVVEAQPGDRVIVLPDQHIAQNVARQTGKKVITWAGTSASHAAFDTGTVERLRRDYPEIKILAHPQTRPAIAAAADFVGSSAAMAEWLKAERPAHAAVLTDPTVVENLASEMPATKFVTEPPAASAPDQQVPLETLLWSLHTLSEEVTVPEDLALPARAAVRRMLEISGRRGA